MNYQASRLIIVGALLLWAAVGCSALGTEGSNGVVAGDEDISQAVMDGAVSDGPLRVNPPNPDVRLRVDGRRIVDGQGNEVRLRGIYTRAEWLTCEDEVRQFKRWGINFVRLLLTYDEDYWEVVNNGVVDLERRCVLRPENWAQMDERVRWLERNGIYYIIEVHWRALGLTDELLRPDLIEEQFPEFYRQVAQRYRELDYLVGYCMFSEIYVAPRLYSAYRDICTAIVDAVHEVDPERIVSATGVQTSGPSSMIDAIHIDRPNVIYDFHFYSPKGFTHYRDEYGDVRYPGWITGNWWSGVELVDADYLARELQPVLDFSQRWNVPVWCGEFGAFNHAPDNSSERWERDMAHLFEDNGIPWIFWTWHLGRTSVPEYWKELWRAEAPDYRTTIVPHGGPFSGSIEVSLHTWLEGAELRYTLDGREPSEDSTLYTEPFEITTNTTVRARAFRDDINYTPVDVASFYELPMRSPDSTAGGEPGLVCSYYEISPGDCACLETLTPIETTVVERIDRNIARRDNGIALEFRGYIEVPRDGIYRFYTTDAGISRLMIGDALIVNNRLSRWIQRKSGFIALEAGRHRLEVLYCRADERETFYSAERQNEWFMVEYEGPGIEKQPIPSSALYHD
ncbi:MAG: cellulase family glycosylhydrolase [Sedimentisphaerales bacterium]|nr:cellulase family glycosylhydrolase [Sedimentisphaerales bacterium]